MHSLESCVRAAYHHTGWNVRPCVEPAFLPRSQTGLLETTVSFEPSLICKNILAALLHCIYPLRCVYQSATFCFPFLSAHGSGSQPGCGGTLGCHLQYPGGPRANAFLNILLKIHFQTVIKPWSKIVLVRHWVPQNIILFCRVPQA